LINILISKGDLFDALRYAEVSFRDLFTNGIDDNDATIATGAYNLADIIYRQHGDLIRAEELARESLRIRTLVYDSSHNHIGISCSLLASILGAQGKYIYMYT
jgi:hypothetical protein